MRYLLLTFLLTFSALAQETPTLVAPSNPILTARGIQNGDAFDMDKKERDPLLTVAAEYVEASSEKGAHGRIIVDATLLNNEFSGYPLRFDFFVNRKLLESQYRSPQLPGPIGIEVPSSAAAVPFNYAVVATVLHPNRSFTSVVEGAVFTSSLGGTYTCNLTLPDSDAVSSASVAIGQVSDNVISISFVSSADKITASGDFTISGTEISGTLHTDKDGTITESELTGSVTKEGTTLKSFEAEDDTGVKLDCSS